MKIAIDSHNTSGKIPDAIFGFLFAREKIFTTPDFFPENFPDYFQARHPDSFLDHESPVFTIKLEYYYETVPLLE